MFKANVVVLSSSRSENSSSCTSIRFRMVSSLWLLAADLSSAFCSMHRSNEITIFPTLIGSILWLIARLLCRLFVNILLNFDDTKKYREKLNLSGRRLSHSFNIAVSNTFATCDEQPFKCVKILQKWDFFGKLSKLQFYSQVIVLLQKGTLGSTCWLNFHAFFDQF